MEESKAYINHQYLKPNMLIKRKYQTSIFIATTQGNCLVVIPTGLGKTIIAILLTLHRLKVDGSKMVFLAPTRPLVEQHYATFQNLTTFDDLELVMMTGNISPEKRKAQYTEGRCFFLTPQILQNDLISNSVDLKDFSLIIFDEAHRATGNYAYNFIAKKYHQQSSDPKVLALTASPGKNREKIEEVMGNLNLNAIEIRTESDPDVKPYIQDVETQWINVELPEEMLQISKEIEKLASKVYIELQNNDLLESASPGSVNRKHLLVAGKKLDSLIARERQGADLPRLLYCKKLLANGIRLSHMGELLEAQGIFALSEYLEKNIEEVSNGRGGKSLLELFQATPMVEIIDLVQQLKKKNVDHPKIEKLTEILQEKMQNPDSRILVFCHFRDTVRNIEERLTQIPSIRASKFVGQQNKGVHKGFSQKEQIEILSQFKAGTYNVLIATSVAEEGLDISECDVVIFYDIVPSEVRAIQRRGRTGRNRSGEVILLKTLGTREEGYFWAEKRREKEMKRVLKEIKADLKQKKNLRANPYRFYSLKPSQKANSNSIE